MARKLPFRAVMAPVFAPRLARAARASALAILAVGGAAGVARDASAQAVTGIAGTVLRLEPNGSDADNFNTGNPHAGGVPENAINYEDCAVDLRYQFTLLLSGVPTDAQLVAWAGPDDCTAAAARAPSTATCWPLSAGPLSQGDSKDDAGAPITTVTLSMRDIISQAQPPTSGPTNVAYSPATAAACDQQSQTAQENLAIYFFFVDSQGNALGVAQAYPIVSDTRAANVGADFSVQEQLDSQLTVTITATPDPDTVRYNVYCDPPPGQENVVATIPYDAASNGGLCYPTNVADAAKPSTADAAPADATPADADMTSVSDGAAIADGAIDGATDAEADAASDSATSQTSEDSGIVGVPIYDDAGGDLCGAPLNDAGIPAVGGCTPSGVLTAGGGHLESANTSTTIGEDGAVTTVETEAGASVYVGGLETFNIPARYLCGTASVDSPTVTITGLTDGDFYNVAVAAVDGVGNIGPLSLQCGNPVELQDFWYAYLAAGGQAGGGYCSAEGVGVPAGTSGLGLLAVASVVALLRKRRK
jgi:hypothetical protein